MANILATYGIETAEATVPVNENLGANDPFFSCFTSLADFPEYVPEDQNDEILVRGRWLERGGAAFIVSTAGTGKSIHSMQTALCWSEGVEFCGLVPRRPLSVWILQSEDSPSRVTIDREDIVAELRESHPGVDWREASRKVKFVRLSGKVGAEWLDALDGLLESAKLHGMPPDVIVINPFMAFIGGPVSDGSYVTPFLRGGILGREATCGLQDILERHRVGALIYHHTPKPPTEKEVEAWLKSRFPEYQGAGSSDITNWGRSFVTMMKVPGHPRTVMLTAGKNGSGLKWPEVDGRSCRFIHWSDGDGIDGGPRHAWRECTEEEVAEASGKREAVGGLNADVAKLCSHLRAHPSCQSDFFTCSLGGGKIYSDNDCGIPRNRFRAAWAYMRANCQSLGLDAYSFKLDNGVACAFYGVGEACRERAVSEAGARGLSPSSVTSLGMGADGCQMGAAAPMIDGCHRGISPFRGIPVAAPIDGAMEMPDQVAPINLTEDPLF